jgi:hypothetical protein
VIQRLRTGFRDTPLGPTVVIWSFGYLLLDAIAFLIGRAAPGVTLLASLPMFALGIGQTLALNHLRNRPQLASAWVRWPVLIVAVIAATVVQTLFDVYWMRLLAKSLFPHWQDWALDLELPRLLTVAFGYVWTFCLALTLLAAMRSARKAQASATRAATAEAEAANAVSAALRLQLNPHFLFNTLNSIAGLVTLDRKQEAENMIERLADFLRASLNANPIEDVPLSQEIDTIDAYLHIEAVRFGDRLEIEIDLAPETEQAKVPNFILQPLVENAIKHGVSALQGTALLYIASVREADMLVLTVVNSSPESNGESSRLAGTGVGLANSRQRLANRYGARASLETGPVGDRYRATIRMPFVP